MRVAFLGVAHSHPFTDAANLRARGVELVGVWDAHDEGRAADFAARFAVPRVRTVDEVLGFRPDLLIATPRTRAAPALAERLAAGGIRTFFNKLVAATPEDFGAFALAATLARERGTRIETASVLRFAPRLKAFAEELRGKVLLSLTVTAQHDISGFLSAERAWQDDPDDGGGTLLNVGVHAWEMLEMLLPGCAFELRTASARRLGTSATRSENVGVVTGVLDGTVPVHVSIAGVPGDDLYRIEAVTSSGILHCELAAPDRASDHNTELGFAGLIDALLAAVPAGRPVVPDAATGRIYSRMLEAATLARASRNGDS